MRKLLLALTFGLVSYLSQAQTYETYRYNNAGVPVRTGYIRTVEDQPKFSGYVAPSDPAGYEKRSEAELRAMKEVLQAKQQAYNTNVQTIQSLIDQCSDAIYELALTDKDLAFSYEQEIRKYVSSINQKADYSLLSVFLPVQTSLKGFLRQLKYASISRPSISYEKPVTYSGTVNVYSLSPILESPDMTKSPIKAYCKSETVEIVRQVDENYYFVRSGDIVGYLWNGWIKPAK